MSAATTAAYLAERLCAETEYAPGTVREALPLAEASDFIVTKRNGLSLEVTCIVDRDRDPWRRFPLTRAELLAVGQACLRYSGTVNRVKMPVIIRVLEVGTGAGCEADRRRLRPLALHWAGVWKKVMIHVWTVDSATGDVWTTAPFGGAFLGRRWFTRTLRGPRRTGPPEPVAVPSMMLRPFATLGLLASLLLVFAAELGFGIAPRRGLLVPDVSTLLAFGAISRGPVLEQGEWYRLLTAAFVHANPVHLFMNGVALFIGGAMVENMLGRAWLLASFVLGALGGSSVSLLLNDARMVSCGASGALLCVAAMGIAGSLRFRRESERVALLTPLLQILIPAFIPLATQRVSGRIDFAAHLGGTAIGAMLAVMLAKTWDRRNPLPRFRRGAAAISLVAALVLSVGAARLVSEHHHWAATAVAWAALMPRDAVPRSESEAVARGADLATRYPRDPRARLANALRLAQAGESRRAEEELRRGLADTEVLAQAFPDRRLETSMRRMLASLLLAEGDRDAAERAVAPVCGAGPNGSVPESLLTLRLCR